MVYKYYYESKSGSGYVELFADSREEADAMALAWAGEDLTIVRA